MPVSRTVLLIGIDPHKVDFSQPGLPPGLNAEIILAGVDRTLKDFHEAGHRVGHCMFDPAEDYCARTAAMLDQTDYDCAVIGGGIRLPPANLVMFERILNTLRRHGPNCAVAFNERPEGSLAAMQRVLGEG